METKNMELTKNEMKTMIEALTSAEEHAVEVIQEVGELDNHDNEVDIRQLQKLVVKFENLRTKLEEAADIKAAKDSAISEARLRNFDHDAFNAFLTEQKLSISQAATFMKVSEDTVRKISSYGVMPRPLTYKSMLKMAKLLSKPEVTFLK